MAEAPAIYKKLPGTGSGALSRTRLWEGPDHLLQVTSWPSGESYRRFFFRDIQAISLRRTARRMWINVGLILGALLTAGPFLFISSNDSSTQAGGAILAGIWLVFILVNTLKGPTCETQIQTAIRAESIPSLTRLGRAEKVLLRIQPHILAAQETPGPAAS